MTLYLGYHNLKLVIKLWIAELRGFCMALMEILDIFHIFVES